jgi:hypothetical protein
LTSDAHSQAEDDPPSRLSLERRLEQWGHEVVELSDRVVELEASLAREKHVQGLLPICSYCKKIRDDKDYWQQVEGYIEDHSAVSFSHGICPDCYVRIVQPQLDPLERPG